VLPVVDRVLRVVLRPGRHLRQVPLLLHLDQAAERRAVAPAALVAVVVAGHTEQSIFVFDWMCTRQKAPNLGPSVL